ncbi:MAG: ABC transporter ATP-binding protein [Acidiferrobacterales bacterium]|jgi:ABC-2 type transport system ATP-binding protein|nr:ABC transporter ATP-binding protein [Acidiferrobacterales bacterium]
MTDTVLIDVQELSRYFGNHCAVNNVSFTVNKGEVVGFLGPNGAGKTTTMKMLTGNLAPSTGSVTIAGHDLLDDPRAAKSAIGYLPEQPPLYRELTVNEYLDFCAALNRIPRDQRLAAREAAKEKCGLTKVADRLIANLSKGYQQRVGIAQAIIHMPPVVILDEPTVGLDPIQIREIRLLIRELGKEHSVILSTHILPEVQATCDRVQIINEGQLVLHDSIDGLEHHLQSASLTVAFNKEAPLSELEGIKGIKKVEPQREGRLRLFYEPDQNPVDEIVRRSAENGWGLCELRPGRVSLEEIFLQLTTEDKADDEEAA